MKLSALFVNWYSACAALSSHASAPLDVLGLAGVAKVTSGKHVKLVFLPVHAAIGEPEEDTSAEGDDGDSSVVPDEMGVGGQWSESLSQGGGESSGEQLNGLDKRTHILGCLGESILKGGDGREDLRDGDEDVNTSDCPDGDRRLVVWVTSLVEAR